MTPTSDCPIALCVMHVKSFEFHTFCQISKVGVSDELKLGQNILIDLIIQDTKLSENWIAESFGNF